MQTQNPPLDTSKLDELISTLKSTNGVSIVAQLESHKDELFQKAVEIESILADLRGDGETTDGSIDDGLFQAALKRLEDSTLRVNQQGGKSIAYKAIKLLAERGPLSAPQIAEALGQSVEAVNQAMTAGRKQKVIKRKDQFVYYV